MRIRCDGIFHSAKTMPSSWDLCIQMVISVMTISSETQGLKIPVLIQVFVCNLAEANTKLKNIPCASY